MSTDEILSRAANPSKGALAHADSMVVVVEKTAPKATAFSHDLAHLGKGWCRGIAAWQCAPLMRFAVLAAPTRKRMLNGEPIVMLGVDLETLEFSLGLALDTLEDSFTAWVLCVTPGVRTLIDRVLREDLEQRLEAVPARGNA